MNKLLREPLVHFLAIGAVIFAAYGVVARRTTERSRIVVTRGQVEALSANFQRTWSRAPTHEEQDDLVHDYVIEEACAREAIARGLDQDDAVIRRRLQEKLEFVTDVAAQTEPTDAELETFLEDHPEIFRSEPRMTFRHVYFSPERRGAHAAADAEAAKVRLTPAGRTEGLGDPFLLDLSFRDASTTEIAMRFGERFASEIEKLPEGSWQGPIASAYGLHLVFVEDRKEGALPTLDTAREHVRREWREAARVEARKKLHDEILKRYDVVVEKAPQ